MATIDNFSRKTTDLNSPSRNGYPIIPSDSDGLTYATRSIWVGTGGNLAVIFSKDVTDTPVILMNVPSGTMLNICVKQVLVAGTSASNLVALY